MVSHLDMIVVTGVLEIVMRDVTIIITEVGQVK